MQIQKKKKKKKKNSSDPVGTLGDTSMYSYPGINLSNFPGMNYPDQLSQLYIADHSTAAVTCSRVGTLPMCICKAQVGGGDDGAIKPLSLAVLFSSFAKVVS